MNKYPVGNWFPSLPEIQRSSGKIEVSVDKMISSSSGRYRRPGEVWYDPERENYICEGIDQDYPDSYYYIADFVVQDGVEQVWVKQDFKEENPENRANYYVRDGNAYYSSSGCSTTSTEDCRLCATLKWGGSGDTRHSTIINNMKDFSYSMNYEGLVRKFF
jgi:hypothetical protein